MFRLLLAVQALAMSDYVDFDDLETLMSDALSSTGSIRTDGTKSNKRPRSSMHTSCPGTLGANTGFCLMPKCDLEQKRGSRWCSLHNCHCENMRYHAEHNKENGSRENRDKWVVRMKDFPPLSVWKVCLSMPLLEHIHLPCP